MDFWIQAGDPRATGTYSAEDVCVAEALETIFPMFTEDAIIVWKRWFIPLSYKYGFSCLIDDLIIIVSAVLAVDTGRISVVWPCSEFQARWTVSWTQEDVQIDSEWMSAPGQLLEMLKKAGPVQLKRSEFLAEWKMPFTKIVEALKVSGYNAKNLKDMPSFEWLASALPKGAYLYPGPSEG